jgi:hypothetical protein
MPWPPIPPCVCVGVGLSLCAAAGSCMPRTRPASPWPCRHRKGRPLWWGSRPRSTWASAWVRAVDAVSRWTRGAVIDCPGAPVVSDDALIQTNVALHLNLGYYARDGTARPVASPRARAHTVFLWGHRRRGGLPVGPDQSPARAARELVRPVAAGPERLPSSHHCVCGCCGRIGVGQRGVLRSPALRTVRRAEQADIIAGALRVTQPYPQLRLAILGGSEAYLVCRVLQNRMGRSAALTRAVAGLGGGPPGCARRDGDSATGALLSGRVGKGPLQRQCRGRAERCGRVAGGGAGMPGQRRTRSIGRTNL